MPFHNDQQSIIKATTTIIPACTVAKSIDSFGNTLQTGYIPECHDAFMFESKGIVNVLDHVYHEPLNRLFLYPTTLTYPNDNIVKISSNFANYNKQDTIIAISNYLYNNFHYQQGITNVTTTASEALALNAGVCQDYAHITISLLRLLNIPARYIAGFMIGEGATHAWIEYFDNGYWYAFDPTNNRPVDSTYIKISQGRDFNDCSINRGAFCGSVQQSIKVNLKVEYYKQKLS